MHPANVSTQRGQKSPPIGIQMRTVSSRPPLATSLPSRLQRDPVHLTCVTFQGSHAAPLRCIPEMDGPIVPHAADQPTIAT